MKNERKQNRIRLLAVMVLSLLVLVCGGIYISATAYTERPAHVSSDGSNVKVRSGAGTSNGEIAVLPDKYPVTIISEAMASDGSKWYEIRFVLNEETKTGYMHSAYLIYDDYSGLDEVEKMTFEELLAAFPESYKTQLLILHDMYPNWKFVAVNTGLEWSDALAAESSNARSLVSTNAISSWKSTEGNAFDWNTSTWKSMDGAKWVTASEEIVAYYLDPRNYLDGSMIFAFITHEYDSEEQNIDGVRSVIGSTFMSNDFTENDRTYDYAEILMEAAQAYGVSPYVLAAMIRIEIGYAGDSPSISGVEAGYENLYNYYNVGAYATATLTANQRGLWYANGEDVGKTTYGRPWNSRYKSLMGGAEFYASTYVARGQNTLYLKRFNVTPTDTYGHQYMTNIQGAASEANVYSLAYNAQAKQQNLVFYIPVYNNMPEVPGVKPTKTGSPNNKLDSITVDGTVLADFNMDTAAYRLEVGSEVEKIVIGATPKDGTAAITGTGEVALALGENKLTVNVTAQNGDVRAYELTVVRAVSADTSLSSLVVEGYSLTPELSADVYDYSVTIPAEVNTVNVTATASSKQAVVEIDEIAELPFGESVIKIKVTAGDGVSAAEYHIKVTRQAATDASLSALSLTGLELSPAFDAAVYEYSVVLPAEQTEVEVTATANSSLATVEITGATEIPVGQSMITVKVTAGDGTTVAEYHIAVERMAVAENVELSSETFKIDESKYITGLTEQPVTAEALAANLSVTGGTVKITAADGVSEVITVGTGTQVKVYDETGVLCDIYTVVIYGDVSGDGKIDALDLMTVRQYLKNKVELSGVYAVAANTGSSGDSKIDALDLMTLRQHLKKRLVIAQ